MATAGGITGYAGLASSAIGTGFKAYGAYLSAQGEKQNFEYQAKLLEIEQRQGEQRAYERQEIGSEQQFKLKVQTKQQLGSQRARIAAHGGRLEGSHLAVLRDTKWVSDLDLQTLTRNTDREVFAIRERARSKGASAVMQRLKGAQIRPGQRAVTSLIADAPKLAQQWYKLNPYVPERTDFSGFDPYDI